MPEQVLRIEPEHELKFKGPFTSPTTSLLKLTNPSDRRVCFKIKTTAPKRYCVRPNAGILEANNSINIAVVFQPCELEPSATKHKFMVQALFAPDGDFNSDLLWKDVDNTRLMDTKLRCTFELPSEVANANEMNNANQEEKVNRAKHDDVNVKSSKAGFDDDLSLLRQENTNLKEEIDKLKRKLKARDSGGPGVGGMMMQQNMGTHANPPALPMLYVAATIVAAIIGLFLGKFVV